MPYFLPYFWREGKWLGTQRSTPGPYVVASSSDGTNLKAALNFVNGTHHFQNADAWREVKPFRNVDAPKVRFLSDDETTRLVNACRPDLRTIVTAALLTGCRYGELTSMKAQAFNQDSDNPQVHIPVSKGGRTRNIFLTSEGFEFFKRAVAGKKGDELIFRHQNGEPWKASDQARPMKEACEGANISPPISFHSRSSLSTAWRCGTHQFCLSPPSLPPARRDSLGFGTEPAFALLRADLGAVIILPTGNVIDLLARR